MGEPEWSRVRPTLQQKSIINYSIIDESLMKASGDVQVVNMNISYSNHYLAYEWNWNWVYRRGKFIKKRKSVLEVCLDRPEKMRLFYLYLLLYFLYNSTLNEDVILCKSFRLQ